MLLLDDVFGFFLVHHPTVVQVLLWDKLVIAKWTSRRHSSHEGNMAYQNYSPWLRFFPERIETLVFFLERYNL